MVKHVNTGKVNNIIGENYDERWSLTDTGSWIQVATVQKKSSWKQNYSRKVNKSQFQTASPHCDTCKNHLFDVMLMTW